MRRSINNNSRCYGVKVKKIENAINYSEEYVNKNFFLTLPIGELLFTVLEFLELLPSFDDNLTDDKLYNFFAEREYDLSMFFSDFKNLARGLSSWGDESELIKLNRIKDYLELCVNNKRLFSVENLKGVALAVLTQENPLFKLFENRTSKYYVRRIISDSDIPFGYTLEEIEKALSNEYNTFTFYTRTQIKTLSELCLLSVFEIIETGKIVQRCVDCKRFFISKRYMNLCNRPSVTNDFRGCKNYHLYLYRKKYKEDEVVKEYYRIYNKLQARTKSQKYFDILVFEDFKNGWNELNKKTKNIAEQKKRKMEFLSMERWK